MYFYLLMNKDFIIIILFAVCSLRIDYIHIFDIGLDIACNAGMLSKANILKNLKIAY